MSTTTLRKPAPQKEKVTQNVPVLVMELIDRRPSSWVKEDSEQFGRPIFLDCPAQQFILPRSVMYGKNKELVDICYMKSAKSIFVETNKKDGFSHNPQTDFIVFEHGVLTVRREGADKNLYDYLKNCSYNRDAENRYEGVDPIFFEINTEVVAEDGLDELTDVTEALQMVTALRTKKPGAAPEYNTERIDALVYLFNIQTGDTPAEKLQSLASVASSRPGYFMRMVADASASMRVVVVKARELGVISTEGPHAMFLDSNKNFYKFNGSSLDERIDELTDFFLNKENKKVLNELNVKTNAAAELKMSS